MSASEASAAPAVAPETAPIHRIQDRGSPTSSSAPSSPRTAVNAGQALVNDINRQKQRKPSTSRKPELKSPTTSAGEAAPGTDEGPDPYPFWPRPDGHSTAKKAPLESPSPAAGVVTPSSSLLSSPEQPPAAGSPQGTGTARRTVPCQYPGCSRLAKYGTRNETPIACQAHKRAGQYTTNRHGELLVATRDGNAFRTPAVAEISSVAMGKADKEGIINSSSGREAATPSPTPVQGLTRANRPAISGGDEGGSPALQDRPCLFPGCNARPVYGLAAAVRPVYCPSHKKGPMMKIVERERDLHHNGGSPKTPTAASRKDPTSVSRSAVPIVPATAVGEKKKSRSPISADKVRARTGSRGSADEEDDSNGRGRKHAKNSHGDDKQSKGNGLQASADEERNSANGSVLPGASTPNGAAAAEPRSFASKMSAAFGMAPSAEIAFLRQVREAARKEAEASGGRRRARVPSRRAFEAAGKTTDESAQWMSREKQEEDARAAMELREQRKQYRAAGLKYGVVLEELVVKTAEATAATGADASGSGGAASGERGPAGGVGTNPFPVATGWRKVSPKVLSAQPLQQVVEQATVTAMAAGEKPGKRARPSAAVSSAK